MRKLRKMKKLRKKGFLKEEKSRKKGEKNRSSCYQAGIFLSLKFFSSFPDSLQKKRKITKLKNPRFEKKKEKLEKIK